MHAPGFLPPLVLVFLVALLAAWALHRIKQPPLVGFLLAGAMLGPHVLGLVRDQGAVEALAEVGAVLLLFTIGLELSLRNLRRLGRIVWGAGPLQLGGTILLMGAVGLAAGYGLRRGLFFGFLVALSSTAIVLKLLIERGEMDSPHGRMLIGILILQDLAVVPMMLLVQPLARGGREAIVAGAIAVAKTAVTAGLLLLAARTVVPRLLRRVVATQRKELFIVAVAVMVLGTALASSALGLSLALGAFLAGLALSESEYGNQAMADVAPFRDVFSALFFVSIGLLFDPSVLVARPLFVLMLLTLVVVGKAVFGALPALMLRGGVRVAVIVGISLAQIGEFSFVLLREGLQADLIEPDVYHAFLGVAILSMVATPWMTEKSHVLGRWLARHAPAATRELRVAGAGEMPAENHVIVFGFGHMGETLARVLSRARVPFRIFDLNPARIRRGIERKLPIEYGDVTSDVVLRHAGIERARAAIVVLSDPRATRQAVSLSRALSPRLFILARTRYLSEIPELNADGADEVVAEEFETSLEISARALRRLGAPIPWVEAETDEIRKLRHDAFRRFRAPESSAEGLQRALPGTRVEYISVAEDWEAVGRSLKELDLRSRSGTIILAVVRDGNATVTPGSDFVLQGADHLLLLGSEEALDEAVTKLRGSGSPSFEPREIELS
jgi:CPA2 family monovalent cation:H+ antiporter-2